MGAAAQVFTFVCGMLSMVIPLICLEVTRQKWKEDADLNMRIYREAIKEMELLRRSLSRIKAALKESEGE